VGLLGHQSCTDDPLKRLRVGFAGMEENCQSLSELSDRFFL